MALKCPECGTMAHARTSSYEAPSVKRSWYQCQNPEVVSLPWRGVSLHVRLRPESGFPSIVVLSYYGSSRFYCA